MTQSLPAQTRAKAVSGASYTERPIESAQSFHGRMSPERTARTTATTRFVVPSLRIAFLT